MTHPIHAERLTKFFGRREALSALDFSVPAGSIFGLIGPNGAGKTTTIKTLMNILRPSSGSAEILGVDSRRLSPREFRRIGYVSENQEMPGEMTVGYFLHYLKPFYPTWNDDLCDEMVRQFELPLDRKLSHLSRGMRIEAALVSSLAYGPELIVLDEPFSGLDPLIRHEFIQTLLDRAEGTTILISSHDVGEIESFASHIGYLEDGHLHFTEEMSTLAARFRQVEILFDAPPTVPDCLPRSWMQPQSAFAMMRFIESRFDHERTSAEIGRIFPQARQVALTPMSLKDIFVALALAGRQTAAAA